MSSTVSAQQELERDCLLLLDQPGSNSIARLRNKHAAFLKSVLGINGLLPPGYLALDASHPWIIFWCVNALAMLDVPLSKDQLNRIGETVLSYQHPNGGFGGGPGQPGHMAATYASVMALSHTGPEFWSRIDREALHRWILSLKTSEGSIKVCAHGEADPRATYCALAVATILGVNSQELRDGIGMYLSRCQTYEGGFANEPFGEAHGGYAFCSLASLMLLYPDDPIRGLTEFCQVSEFRRWLIARQDLQILGFSGRTNKLVDGCYSHWIGGCWPLVSQLSVGVPTPETTSSATPPRPASSGPTSIPDLFSRQGLHDYIIKCCQNTKGGLRDKPGVLPDAYHSNYTLCGLSCAQYGYKLGDSVFDWQAYEALQIDPSNRVPPINPLLGIPLPETARFKAWLDENPSKLNLKSFRSDSFSVSQKNTPGPSPSSREYQGFALYVGATVVLAAYLVWALLPASWLHAIRIDYYPSRWWAVAIPAYILSLMLYTYTALSMYNTEKLTYSPESPETVCDKDTKVHDVPLVDVNSRMYASTAHRESDASR